MLETSAITQQLSEFRKGLVDDGYDLLVDGYADGTARLRIAAGPEACAECLVPKALMVRMLQESLRGLSEIRKIELAYPEE
jgi:hypothetical protein